MRPMAARVALEYLTGNGGFLRVPLRHLVCRRREVVVSLRTVVALVAACCAAGVAHAGGEIHAAPCAPPMVCAPPQAPAPAPAPVVQQRTICRDWPMPTPRHRIGDGFNQNEFYGPTYYYPSAKLYESNNPSYYPFYHPRLWPNYKSAPQYTFGDFGYSSRSGHYWDTYDDWMRGARYGEHQ